MHRERPAAFAVVLLLGLVTSAGAQAPGGRIFSITPTTGIMYWDEASALAVKSPAGDGRFTETKYNPTVGLALDYAVTGPLSAGFYLHAARPTTRGDYFPAVLLDYGARSEVYFVSQRVTVLMYGLQATADFRLNRFEPYVSAGGGASTVILDPQQNDGNSRFSDAHMQLGGGIGFRLGSAGVVKADVRDFMFLNWDRDRLNPVLPAYQNKRLPAVNGGVPAEKSTIHNWRFTVGFSYAPRRDDENPGS